MLAILGLIVLSIVLLYIWRFYEDVKRYPKGPPPLPLIGNLHLFDLSKIHEYLGEVSKKYGNIFTVWLPKPHVVIMDLEGIKEAYVKKGDDFAGRTGLFPDTLFQLVENSGIVFSQGENWKEQRRISLHILRDFGMGKNFMEQQVLLSAQDFLAYLDSLDNKENVDSREPIQIFVANIINKILFGYSYEYNDCDRLMSTANALNRIFADMRKSRLVMLSQLMPFLLQVPGIGQLIRGKFDENFALIWRSVREDVERSLKSWDPDHEPECFVHAYYNQMKANPMLDYDNLINACSDLLLAGMETTATTLRWSTLYLAKYLDVQEKMRAEILSALGTDGKPSMAQRTTLPYTWAAIQEIQRCAGIIAITPVHRTLRDTTIGSVRIPVDTFVIGQVYHIMRNPLIFKDSSEFKPERFLMEDGITPNKEVIDNFWPFSIGKRQCVGESMAKTELFIGLIMFLQRYKIEPLNGETIDLEPTLSTFMVPKSQALRISRLSSKD